MPNIKNMALQGLYRLGVPAILRRLPAPENSMTVLAYHAVTDDPAYALPGIRVTPRLFAQQIAHLVQHYTVVDLADALEQHAQGRPLPPRAVAITFDDGYLDNYTNAFGVLKAHRACATIFATVDPVLDGGRFWVSWLYEVLRSERPAPALIDEVFGVRPKAGTEAAFNAISGVLNYSPRAEREVLLDRFAERLDPGATPPRMLNVAQMREMQAGGIRFGSHTLSHPILANIDHEERQLELRRSRARLIEALDRDVPLIAYPNGRAIPRNFDASVMADCRAAGYRAAVTSRRGPVTSGADAFAIPRMGVSQMGGIARFAVTLERFRAAARRSGKNGAGA